MLSASSSSTTSSNGTASFANGKVNGMDPSHSKSNSSHAKSANNCQELKKVFDAAVNVIRNLPTDVKDAPFTPSDELKLKFYAFFKQATEGPNNTPKPAFYDVVGRYKWSAWTNLGVMSKEDAMKGYIEELKQIVETMALTQPVADFYDVLGPFYDFVFPDKSPTKTPVKNGNATFAATASAAPIEKKHLNGGLPSQVYHQDTVENESEGEEFSDTYDHISDESNAQVSHRQVSSSVTDGDEIISARGESELTPPRFGRVGHSYSQAGRSMSSGQPGSPQHGYGSAGSDYPLGSAGASGGNGGSGGRPPVSIPEVNEQIAVAILRLQHSMEQVCYRLDSIESRIERQASPVVRDNRSSQIPASSKNNSWWPLDNLSPTTTVFLLAWPFVTHFLVEKIRDRHRK